MQSNTSSSASFKISTAFSISTPSFCEGGGGELSPTGGGESSPTGGGELSPTGGGGGLSGSAGEFTGVSSCIGSFII